MVKEKTVAVEFEAYIRNGMIEIPLEQRPSLTSYDEPVRIIVLAKENGIVKREKSTVELTPRLQDAKEKGYDSFIDYLIDHPIIVPNVTYLSREEANKR